MDIYDPQTLGFVVFGGFMVISAIGIALVSTFSMKETSYEEALAKQRKELEKTQPPRSEKKKKDKPSEKRSRIKKKDDKPNGKLPEPEPTPEASETVAKVEPAPTLIAPAKSAPVLETVTKEVPIMAVPPVGAQTSSPVASSPPPKKNEAIVSHDEVKQNGQSKKKVASKKKVEPKFLPSRNCLNTIAGQICYIKWVGSFCFTDKALQCPNNRGVSVPTALSRAGAIVPHLTAERYPVTCSRTEGAELVCEATQKGDPVAALKRQLEDKEKQLSAEQEDAAAAKNRLRELTKELNSEKSKVVSVEARLKEQLSSRDQEITALQARMQASYKDHVAETQQLNAKEITFLADSLPGAQRRLWPTSKSIQSTLLKFNRLLVFRASQQNAELAKLRQECTKLTKDLSDKTEALQADEQQKKSLEAKVAAFEKQVGQLQSSQAESERTLQKRLDEVGEELRKSQSSSNSLQAELEKAKREMATLTELQTRVSSAEADAKDKCSQVESLQSQLSQVSSEKSQLLERIRSIEALLEASTNKQVEENKETPKQVSVYSHPTTAIIFSPCTGLNLVDLREKNWKAMDALTSAEQMCQEKLSSTKKAKVRINAACGFSAHDCHPVQRVKCICSPQCVVIVAKAPNSSQDAVEQQLVSWQTETRETLQTLFPEISFDTQQTGWLQEFKHKAQESLSQQTTESPELAMKLKEAEESRSTLQAECDQYRTVLAETEGMLKDLQKSVEEEELVWKAKIAESKDDLKKALEQIQTLESATEKLKLENQSTEQLREQVMLLEAQVEKQLESASSESQNYSEEVAQLKDLLSETQSQLEMTKLEAQKQSEELALVRQHLSEMKERVQDGEAAGSQNAQTELQPSKLQSQLQETVEKLENEQTVRQQLSEEFEQAQKSVLDLQAELESLRAAGDSPVTDTDDASQLKDRLDKEKKLTKDLGQAATKLQQLLKTTQEQLAKEKETVKKLQDQLQGQVLELEREHKPLN
ncbi:RRBP1 protein, partial [Amia calva]|nr:RRBP1 protein [Amia calva]